MPSKLTAAIALSAVAGGLIFLNGLGALIVGLAFVQAGWTGADWLVLKAFIALLSAILVVAGAVMLAATPRTHGPWGVVIAFCSGLSLIVGGGLFVGWLLGVAGGILATAWTPPSSPAQAYRLPHDARPTAAWGAVTAVPPAPGFRPATGPPAPEFDLAAIPSICPTCGHPVHGFTFCPRCGTRL